MNNRGFIPILLIIIVFVVVGMAAAGSFLLLQHKVADKNEMQGTSNLEASTSAKVSTVSSTSSIKLDALETAAIVPFVPYTGFLYLNESLDFISGRLGTEDKTTTLFAGKGVWGVPAQITTSPDRKYATFLRLNDSLIDTMIRDPRHPFDGKQVFDLWLINLTDVDHPQLTKLFTEMSIPNGDTRAVVEWRNNSHFDYVKSMPNRTWYTYDLEKKTSVEIADNDQFYGLDHISPDKKFNALSSGVSNPTGEKDLYMNTYRLDLYKNDNQELVQTLISNESKTKMARVGSKELPSNENFGEVNFLLNHHIFFTHTTGRDQNFYRKLEVVNLEGVRTEIQGGSFAEANSSGFSQFSLSPNGGYISAAVQSLDTVRNDKIFVYNLNTENKSILGTQRFCMRNYYWLSEDEILVNTIRVCTSDPKEIREAFTLNIATGEEKEVSALRGKNVLEVF